MTTLELQDFVQSHTAREIELKLVERGIIIPNTFGVTIKTKFLNNNFPLEFIKQDLQVRCNDNYYAYEKAGLMPFYTFYTKNQELVMIYPDGTIDFANSFKTMLLDDEEQERIATSKVIGWIFNGCISFSEVLQCVSDFYRYPNNEKVRAKPAYVNSRLPIVYTMKQLKEKIGHDFVIDI